MVWICNKHSYFATIVLFSCVWLQESVPIVSSQSIKEDPEVKVDTQALKESALVGVTDSPDARDAGPGLEKDTDDPQGIVHSRETLKNMKPGPGVQFRVEMPVPLEEATPDLRRKRSAEVVSKDVTSVKDYERSDPKRQRSDEPAVHGGSTTGSVKFSTFTNNLDLHGEIKNDESVGDKDNTISESHRKDERIINNDEVSGSMKLFKDDENVHGEDKHYELVRFKRRSRRRRKKHRMGKREAVKDLDSHDNTESNPDFSSELKESGIEAKEYVAESNGSNNNGDNDDESTNFGTGNNGKVDMNEIVDDDTQDVDIDEQSVNDEVDTFGNNRHDDFDDDDDDDDEEEDDNKNKNENGFAKDDAQNDVNNMRGSEDSVNVNNTTEKYAGEKIGGGSNVGEVDTEFDNTNKPVRLKRIKRRFRGYRRRGGRRRHHYRRGYVRRGYRRRGKRDLKHNDTETEPYKRMHLGHESEKPGFLNDSSRENGRVEDGSVGENYGNLSLDNAGLENASDYDNVTALLSSENINDQVLNGSADESDSSKSKISKQGAKDLSQGHNQAIESGIGDVGVGYDDLLDGNFELNKTLLTEPDYMHRLLRVKRRRGGFRRRYRGRGHRYHRRRHRPRRYYRRRGKRESGILATNEIPGVKENANPRKRRSSDMPLNAEKELALSRKARETNIVESKRIPELRSIRDEDNKEEDGNYPPENDEEDEDDFPDERMEEDEEEAIRNIDADERRKSPLSNGPDSRNLPTFREQKELAEKLMTVNGEMKKSKQERIDGKSAPKLPYDSLDKGVDNLGNVPSGRRTSEQRNGASHNSRSKTKEMGTFATERPKNEQDLKDNKPSFNDLSSEKSERMSLNNNGKSWYLDEAKRIRRAKETLMRNAAEIQRRVEGSLNNEKPSFEDEDEEDDDELALEDAKEDRKREEILSRKLEAASSSADYEDDIDDVLNRREGDVTGEIRKHGSAPNKIRISQTYYSKQNRPYTRNGPRIAQKSYDVDFDYQDDDDDDDDVDLDEDDPIARYLHRIEGKLDTLRSSLVLQYPSVHIPSRYPLPPPYKRKRRSVSLNLQDEKDATGHDSDTRKHRTMKGKLGEERDISQSQIETPSFKPSPRIVGSKFFSPGNHSATPHDGTASVDISLASNRLKGYSKTYTDQDYKLYLTELESGSDAREWQKDVNTTEIKETTFDKKTKDVNMSGDSHTTDSKARLLESNLLLPSNKSIEHSTGQIRNNDVPKERQRFENSEINIARRGGPPLHTGKTDSTQNINEKNLELVWPDNNVHVKTSTIENLGAASTPTSRLSPPINQKTNFYHENRINSLVNDMTAHTIKHLKEILGDLEMMSNKNYKSKSSTLEHDTSNEEPFWDYISLNRAYGKIKKGAQDGAKPPHNFKQKDVDRVMDILRLLEVDDFAKPFHRLHDIVNEDIIQNLKNNNGKSIPIDHMTNFRLLKKMKHMLHKSPKLNKKKGQKLWMKINKALETIPQLQHQFLSQNKNKNKRFGKLSQNLLLNKNLNLLETIQNVNPVRRNLNRLLRKLQLNPLGNTQGKLEGTLKSKYILDRIDKTISMFENFVRLSQARNRMKNLKHRFHTKGFLPKLSPYFDDTKTEQVLPQEKAMLELRKLTRPDIWAHVWREVDNKIHPRSRTSRGINWSDWLDTKKTETDIKKDHKLNKSENIPETDEEIVMERKLYQLLDSIPVSEAELALNTQLKLKDMKGDIASDVTKSVIAKADANDDNIAAIGARKRRNSGLRDNRRSHGTHFSGSKTPSRFETNSKNKHFKGSFTPTDDNYERQRKKRLLYKKYKMHAASKEDLEDLYKMDDAKNTKPTPILPVVPKMFPSPVNKVSLPDEKLNKVDKNINRKAYVEAARKEIIAEQNSKLFINKFGKTANVNLKPSKSERDNTGDYESEIMEENFQVDDGKHIGKHQVHIHKSLSMLPKMEDDKRNEREASAGEVRYDDDGTFDDSVSDDEDYDDDIENEDDEIIEKPINGDDEYDDDDNADSEAEEDGDELPVGEEEGMEVEDNGKRSEPVDDIAYKAVPLEPGVRSKEPSEVLTWGEWSACSVSCGVGQRFRASICGEPGQLCQGKDASEEAEPCSERLKC